MHINNLPIADELKPVSAYLADPDRASLAIITNVEGPSYRPIGAMMTLFSDKHWVGTLSSGCIESDINVHASLTQQDGMPKLVKYGRGSPYIDIKLPCGGGLEIFIMPDPDRRTLEELNTRLQNRQACTMRLDLNSGEIAILDHGETARDGNILYVRYVPDPQFLIFGKGPEASTFSALVHAAGYPCLLSSPDDETLDNGKRAGVETRHIPSPIFPDDLQADTRTAIILFFHDHDWEPEILMGALKTDAFYIGAQGSKAANASRMIEMQDKGATDFDLARLSGPIGLIPSTRDAKTLAVSVLAEVLLKAQMKT